MNLIEAWKQAKEGQAIKQNATFGSKILRKTTDDEDIRRFIFQELRPEFLLADDWEIAKEKKKIVYQKVEWELGNAGRDITIKSNGVIVGFGHLGKPPMIMTLEWEE